MIFRYIQSGETTPSYKTQVHSHGGIKVIIEHGDMRTILLAVALLALFYSCTFAFQISLDSSGISSVSYDLAKIKDSIREKRQVETFDDEYPTAISQNEEEEPGFWDRIVKVALKLFNRFIEWLNSS